jgi:2-keto-3-deoxy-L-rhamnonate aldolase RhmA
MEVNRVKQALRAGECVVGTMISEARNPEVVYVLAAAGMDFVMVDTEHGSSNPETVQDLVRSARSAGLVPLARVTENQYPYIARILDTGAMGIMVPRVHTPEQARLVVASAKYPPQGTRGFGARGVVTDYKTASVSEIVKWANDHTLVIVQIESGEAVNGIEDIARVEGIDVALIGPNDLSISLGIPGDFGHPRFAAAVERTFDMCLKHRVSPAIHTGDLEILKRYKDMGMRFLMYSSESRMLLNAATQVVRQLTADSRKAGTAAY